MISYVFEVCAAVLIYDVSCSFPFCVYIFNTLMSVFHAPVLLMIMNFVITLPIAGQMH